MYSPYYTKMMVKEIIKECRELDFDGNKGIFSKNIQKFLDKKSIGESLQYPQCLSMSHPYSKRINYPTTILNKNSHAYLVQLFLLDANQIPMLSNLQRIRACGTCGGYSGTCSLYSPYLMNFIGKRKLLLVSSTLDYFFRIRAVTHDFKKKLTIITAILSADKMSELVVRLALNVLHQKYKGMVLYLGNCPRCRKCSVLKKEPCLYPKDRSFSLESVGVDLETFHLKKFGSILPWYYKGTSKLPRYITRYGGILVDEDLDLYEVMSFFKKSVVVSTDYLLSTDYFTESPKLRIEQLKIPFGYHKGSLQEVYELSN